MDIANYVQIMIEALTKKAQLLEEILRLCKEQDECVRKELPNLIEYTQHSDKKAELSGRIEKIDEGFLSVYERVKDELENNPTQYIEEIRKMKSLVTAISEKSAAVSVTEQRLTTEFKKKIGNGSNCRERSVNIGIGGAKSINSNGAMQAYSNNVANKYSQTMNGMGMADSNSTFINQKK